MFFNEGKKITSFTYFAFSKWHCLSMESAHRQCFYFSGHIHQVILKIIYFHYHKQKKSGSKYFFKNLILKTSSLLHSSRHEAEKIRSWHEHTNAQNHDSQRSWNLTVDTSAAGITSQSFLRWRKNEILRPQRHVICPLVTYTMVCW